MFIEQISDELAIYFVLYGVSGTAVLIAAVYLLWRRGNAFAADVTPPLRLRRWAASFFIAAALSHVWWLFFYFFSDKILSKAHVATAVFDCTTLIVTIVGTLLAMLQDRRRPMWPVMTGLIPIVVLGAALMVSPSAFLLRILIVYFLSAYLLFTIYMVVAARQYGRWLCDNFADLENKRVWLSQLLIIGAMLLFTCYANDDGSLAKSIVMVSSELVLSALLLWRVETLPQLTIRKETVAKTAETIGTLDLSAIERMLDERCLTPQLYLQHDLSLQQLANALGTNRSYLSQYFSRQNITYNIYINNLRINHFVSRYREVVATKQPFTVQQLARESGYRSYSTFSLAFKQRMGQSVTAWMRQASDEV
jgi:AraC-like DNA-binding protein